MCQIAQHAQTVEHRLQVSRHLCCGQDLGEEVTVETGVVAQSLKHYCTVEFYKIGVFYSFCLLKSDVFYQIQTSFIKS